MPRYEELRLNHQKKSNGYRQRSISAEQSKNNLAKPLIFAIFVIIIFAIIFSIIKTYGPSVSIAFKDFFRIAQPEAIFSEVTPTVLENEDVSFLSTIPGFRFFVPSDDDTAIEIVAEETNERVGARVRNESDDMFEEFSSTSRITRDALAPFFNNVLSTVNSTNTNVSTNLLNVTNLVNAFGLTNKTIISNKDNLSNKKENKNEVVESTTFDEVLKPRTEVYDRTKMKPAYTRRYTENDMNNIVFETNTYAKPVIEEREKFLEYTDEELEENRKEFYDANDLEKTDDVRKITEVPKGRVAESTKTPKNDIETVNISKDVFEKASPKTKNKTTEDKIILPKETILPKEKTVKKEIKTPEVTRQPKENIIVPSPLPETVRNNNNIERITSTKENNNLVVKEDNNSLLKNNETLLNNNTDFNSIITNETYLPTETSKEKETSTVSRVPSGKINYDNGIKKSGIFLVEYNEYDGTISLVFKERDIDKEKFTLEKAILTLLEGATDSENNNNIISIIPKSVELLDIFREDNTVYLNFSSDFEYNAIGNEGMLVQLYQFVYTVTQFDDVDNVVFLIEGKYNEFIGAEGSIVNSPFQRLVRDDNVLIDVIK